MHSNGNGLRGVLLGCCAVNILFVCLFVTVFLVLVSFCFSFYGTTCSIFSRDSEGPEGRRGRHVYGNKKKKNSHTQAIFKTENGESENRESLNRESLQWRIFKSGSL